MSLCLSRVTGFSQLVGWRSLQSRGVSGSRAAEEGRLEEGFDHSSKAGKIFGVVLFVALL